MTADINPEDIFSDFAMEEALTPEVLNAYIAQYPQLALELTDLFHDLTMVDLSAAVESMPLETKSAGTPLAEGIASVSAALSGDGLRALALRLALPRDFIAGFRDAKVRLGSVPAAVLTNLARAIDVKIQYLIAYIQQAGEIDSAMAFKADGKPRASSVLEYDEFIESLGLTDTEAAALERLAEPNGPD